jgi:hypothetical protein
VRDLGYEFAMGAIKALSITALAVMGFLAIVGGAVNYFRIGFDDTDNRRTGERSDLRLHTDYGTGCQYVRATDGGIIPRLSSEGAPICRGRIS